MSGHADERNEPSHGDVAAWAKTSADLDEACEETGRDPSEIRRSIQLFVPPAGEGHLDEQLAVLPELEARGCQHVGAVVLPTADGAAAGALRGAGGRVGSPGLVVRLGVLGFVVARVVLPTVVGAADGR